MIKKIIVFAASITFAISASGQLDPKKLTVEEKIDLLCADAPAISRLGVMRYDWWSEALHGVARAGKATAFPKPIGMGATWDPELILRIATAISDEARAKYHKALKEKGYSARLYGLTFFSPTLNIARDLRWGRTNECFAEDPLLVSDMGVAFVKGMQGNDDYYLKTVATAKHFAANNEENRRLNGSATVDEVSLREYYLPGFEAAVKEGKVASLMGAYNALNGIPCCANPWLLNDVLRNEWGFHGVVISDGSAVGKIHTHHKYTATAAEASAVALKAGCDMTLRDEYRKGLRDAYKQGLVSDTDIDKAVTRVADLRNRLGINSANDYSPYSTIPFSVVECPEHRALAQEASEKSIILLKNDGILPLSFTSETKRTATAASSKQPASSNQISSKRSRIALIGDAFRTTYYGDYAPRPEHNATLFDCLSRDLAGKAELSWAGTKSAETVLSKYLLSQPTEKAYDGIAAVAKENEKKANSNPNAETNSKKIVNENDSITALASRSDIVLLYIRDDNSSEGRDRKTLALTQAQIQLIQSVCEANPNTVLLLGSGTANILTPIAHLPRAIVNVWISGQGEAQAISNILTGRVNPSGKTPVTFFKDESELPALDDYDITHGRTYQYFQGQVLYPFGYGLSYTTYKYSKPRVSKNSQNGFTAEVKIKNTGKRDGEEIVQCYAACPSWEKTGLKRRLVAYKRVAIKRGETKTVTLDIPQRMLQRWDTDRKRWTTTHDTFTIDVVPSSDRENSSKHKL